MNNMRHVLVTGAGGFIGTRLARALVAHPDFAATRITLNDLALPDTPIDGRVRAVQGDFGDPAVLADLIDGGVDLAFHLGGVLGGAAEADFSGARRINIDATMALLDALRRPEAPPRLVFTSSIAVFGPPLPDLIDDDTIPLPLMTYAAQKRMVEIAIEQMSARGWIDGLALRLPGIVARPGADIRLKSAFLNAVFFAVGRGEDFTLPVSPEGTTWLISVAACVDALMHAASVPPATLGRRRAMTLPAQRVHFAELVAALKAHFPGRAATVTYAPDPATDEQFGRQPPLATQLADALGFRHDGDLATLVARASREITP